MTYEYRPYPRRLYLNGEVLADDPHATNSVVVANATGEAEARAKGYRKAYEADDSPGGNGGSQSGVVPFPPTSESLPQTQGGAAPASADPVLPDDVDFLRAEAKRLGLKVHHKAGAQTLKDAIAKAGK